MRALLGALLLASSLLLPSPAAAAIPAVWRVAMVIYPDTDVVCQGVRIRSSLSADERDAAVLRAKRFRRKVERWSDYMADVRLTFIWAGTLTRVTDYGPGCWPTAGDVSAMGDWPSGFDSVFVQYAGNIDGFAAGLSYDGYEPFGSTYGAAEAWQDDRPSYRSHWEAKVIVHEWLHGVGGFYRRSFSSIPDLHSMEQRGYTSDSVWYDDFLSGHVNGSLGLARQVWDSAR